MTETQDGADPGTTAADASSVGATISITDFAKFVVDNATRSALDVVSACAVDGAPYWELLFSQGLADAISEDQEFESEFFQRLCAKRGLPYSARIVDTYLQQMPDDRRKRFLDVAALKRKAHPINQVFYGASFMNPSGQYMLDVFKVFVKHGLTPEKVDVVAARCFDDLERTCNLVHEDFMTTVVPMLTRFPEELAQRIVSRSAQAPRVISILVTQCGVSITTFSDPKIMVMARPDVQAYISAMEARLQREPARSYQAPAEDD